MNFKIFWADEAVKNLEQIIEHLSTNWTEKEVNHFKLKLSEQLRIIVKFPKVFPISETTPRLRKAVVTKQTLLFYQVKEKTIYIAYLFDSRQNPERIK